MSARRKTPRRTAYHASRISRRVTVRNTLHGSRSATLVGIGIDLLCLERAGDLLQRHKRSFFDRILSPIEKRRKLACSNFQLARYFTAKEAFFKSSGLAWTDFSGFSGMWIEKILGNKFEMGCADSNLKGRGEFFKRGNIWGAKVQTWKIN